MNPIFNLTVGMSLIASVGCSAPSLFPPDATGNLDQLEFGVLHAKPDVFTGRVVQLAGRIIGVQESPNGILIRAQELPINEHPVYGPAEMVQPMSEFAILYSGKVDPAGLWYGNKFVIVAVAQGAQRFAFLDETTRTIPYVVARCMHVWKTGEYGSYRIEDFPNTTDGYYPLERQTYCTS